MQFLKTHHLLVAGVLFAIALGLYVIGFTQQAVVASILAVIVEVIGWIVVAKHRPVEDSKRP